MSSQPGFDESWLTDSLERFASSRDTTTRDEIAAHTSWIATRCARRFATSGEPFEDLQQVAQIGLLKAIDRFDPGHGVPFGAFATPTIIGELRRHFRDHTWSVHVPRRAKDMRTSVNAMRDELSSKLQRPPLVTEIAQRLGVEPEAVIEALEANNAYSSYSLDQAASNRAATEERTFDEVLDHEVITELLQRLPPRERRILYLRYFEELSQAQIAERIGTSQVHVGRLISSSLARLRSYPNLESRPPSG